MVQLLAAAAAETKAAAAAPAAVLHLRRRNPRLLQTPSPVRYWPLLFAFSASGCQGYVPLTPSNTDHDLSPLLAPLYQAPRTMRATRLLPTTVKAPHRQPLPRVAAAAATIAAIATMPLPAHRQPPQRVNVKVLLLPLRQHRRHNLQQQRLKPLPSPNLPLLPPAQTLQVPPLRRSTVPCQAP